MAAAATTPIPKGRPGSRPRPQVGAQVQAEGGVQVQQGLGQADDVEGQDVGPGAGHGFFFFSRGAGGVGLMRLKSAGRPMPRRGWHARGAERGLLPTSRHTKSRAVRGGVAARAVCPPCRSLAGRDGRARAGRGGAREKKDKSDESGVCAADKRKTHASKRRVFH